MVFERSEQLTYLFEAVSKCVDSLKQTVTKLAAEAARLQKDKLDMSSTVREVIAKAQARENEIVEKVHRLTAEPPADQREESQDQGPARTARGRVQRVEREPV